VPRADRWARRNPAPPRRPAISHRPFSVVHHTPRGSRRRNAMRFAMTFRRTEAVSRSPVSRARSIFTTSSAHSASWSPTYSPSGPRMDDQRNRSASRWRRVATPRGSRRILADRHPGTAPSKWLGSRISRRSSLGVLNFTLTRRPLRSSIRWRERGGRPVTTQRSTSDASWASPRAQLPASTTAESMRPATSSASCRASRRTSWWVSADARGFRRAVPGWERRPLRRDRAIPRTASPREKNISGGRPTNRFRVDRLPEA